MEWTGPYPSMLHKFKLVKRLHGNAESFFMYLENILSDLQSPISSTSREDFSLSI